MLNDMMLVLICLESDDCGILGEDLGGGTNTINVVEAHERLVQWMRESVVEVVKTDDELLG